MSIKKSGDMTGILTEGLSGNLLNGTRYTKDSPYIITGTKSDNYATTDNYCAVTAGKVYYLVATCYPGWSPQHGYSENSNGKGTIWLYLKKTFDASNYGYDTPVCFTANSATKVAEGVWKYIIPTEMNMARIRLNTYADGTNSVTVKFWDIALIPEDEYSGNGAPAMRQLDGAVTVKEIIEF